MAITFPADSLRILWHTFTKQYPLLRLFFRFGCIVVDPAFVHCHESTQEVLRILIKLRQTLRWNVFSVALLIGSQQSQHLSCAHLHNLQFFVLDIIDSFIRDAYSLRNLTHLDSAIFHNHKVMVYTLNSLKNRIKCRRVFVNLTWQVFFFFFNSLFVIFCIVRICAAPDFTCTNKCVVPIYACAGLRWFSKFSSVIILYL